MKVVFLVVAALLQTATAASVSRVEGEAELIRPDGVTAAHIGDMVSAGDRLHTLKGSLLALSTESGVILQLRSDARLEMKKVDGEPLVLFTEGSINVRSSGKPARIETKYGQIIGTEDSQEFDVSYSGDSIQVFVIRGSVRAEVSDPLKVVFKNASDFGTRVYEAGSISPTVPRTPSSLTVIVYPGVGNPTPNKRRPPAPVTPPVPPK